MVTPAVWGTDPAGNLVRIQGKQDWVLRCHLSTHLVRALWPVEAWEPLAFSITLSGPKPGDLHFETLPGNSQAAGLARGPPLRTWPAQDAGGLGLHDGS